MGAAEKASLGRVARLLRRCLEEGRTVEIERLGTFRPAAGGGFEFTPNRKPIVFLAYAAEDAGLAEALFDRLEGAGCAPWMDRRKLLPGQNWPRAIEGAIETADYFVACFSRHSVRKRGTFQSELRQGLECARQAPIDEVFFIPVRLEECQIPASIRKQYQYVDLFPDPRPGLQRLIRILRRGARRRTK